MPFEGEIDGPMLRRSISAEGFTYREEMITELLDDCSIEVIEGQAVGKYLPTDIGRRHTISYTKYQ